MDVECQICHGAGCATCKMLGLGRDPRMRHGASRGAGIGGRGRRALHGVGVRHGPAPDRPAAVRHPGLCASCTTATCASSAPSANERVGRMAVGVRRQRTLPARAARSDHGARRDGRRDRARYGADLAALVVGRVVEAARHPDSDHLWVDARRCRRSRAARRRMRSAQRHRRCPCIRSRRWARPCRAA